MYFFFSVLNIRYSFTNIFVSYREQQVLSGVKLAVAMVSLLILVVALIVALRNCKNNSSNGAQGGVTSSGGQITIQLSQL